jgi:hypothetical protein
MYRLIFTLALAFGFTCPAGAQIQHVVPPDRASTAGTGGFLGQLANAQRTYQWLIDSGEITPLVGTSITSITYRLLGSASAAWPTTPVTFTNYDIYLSGSVDPSQRSLTFANNIVGTQVQVRSGSLTIPAGAFPATGTPRDFGIPITFNTPYLYTGGDLLIELRHTGFTGTSTSVDALTTSTAGYGTRFSAAWTGNYTGTSGSAGNFAIIQLTAAAAAVPEPTTLAAIGMVTVGGLTWLHRRRRKRVRVTPAR